MNCLPRTLLFTLMFACANLLPAHADVELRDDGTYVLTGLFTFLPEKDILTTSAKFDFGEFSIILFKQNVNEFPGVREMKKTPASFKVKARVQTGANGESVLIVEQILEQLDGGAASPEAT